MFALLTVQESLQDRLQLGQNVIDHVTQGPAEPYLDRESEPAGLDGRPLVFHQLTRFLTASVTPGSFWGHQTVF